MCSVSWSAQYTWSPTSGKQWAVNANWTPSTGYPSTVSDTAIFTTADRCSSTTITIGRLEILANDTLFGTGNIILQGSKTLLRIGNGNSLVSNKQIVYYPEAKMTLISFESGASFSGTGANYIGASTTDTVFIPALTYTGSGTWTIIHNTATFKVLLSGNVALSSNLTITGGTSSQAEFNTKNFNLSCAGLTSGVTSATGKLLTVYGSSIVSVSSFSQTNGSYTTGYSIDSLQSAKFICSGNWTFGGNHTVVPGTSKISTTGTCTFTSNGKEVYDLTDSLGALTFADSPSIANDFTILSGNSSATTWSGYTMTVGGDFNHDGTGTANFGTGITMTGNSAVLHVGASTGAITSSACNLTLSGASASTDIDKYVQFKNGIFNHASDVTIGGGYDSLRFNKITLSDSTGIKIVAGKKLVLDSIGDIEGSAGKLCRVQSGTGGSAFTLTMPSDTVSYVYFKDVSATDTIWATDGTSIDGGGNTNIIFAADTVPVISSITPEQVGPGDTVTLAGTGFGAIPTVIVNTTTITSYISRDSIHATFIIPTLTNGTYNVIVQNNVYGTRDTITIEYLQPFISSVKPVWQKRGLTFKVRGYGFGTEQGDGVLRLGISSLLVAKTWTDTLVEDTIPASWSPRGTYNVILENNCGAKDTGSIRVLIPTITGTN